MNGREVFDQTSPQDEASLPFAAPLFWWHRGEPGEEITEGGVAHFGGWASTREKFEEIDKPWPDKVTPKLHLESFVNAQGEVYEVYNTRSLLFAVIGYREGWFENQSGSGNYSKVQYLVWLGHLENKVIGSWGPAVLTARGFASKSLKSVIRSWGVKTEELRRAFDPDAPYNLFYMAVGTFGDEVKQEKVGKSVKNYITPPSAMYPTGDKFSVEWIGKMYVGKDTESQMIQVAELAKPWLDAWKKPEGDKPGSNYRGYDAETSYNDTRSPSVPAEDEFPF